MMKERIVSFDEPGRYVAQIVLWGNQGAIQSEPFVYNVMEKNNEKP